jgi:hypothetical protein
VLTLDMLFVASTAQHIPLEQQHCSLCAAQQDLVTALLDCRCLDASAETARTLLQVYCWALGPFVPQTPSSFALGCVWLPHFPFLVVV